MDSKFRSTGSISWWNNIIRRSKKIKALVFTPKHIGAIKLIFGDVFILIFLHHSTFAQNGTINSVLIISNICFWT